MPAASGTLHGFSIPSSGRNRKKIETEYNEEETGKCRSLLYVLCLQRSI